LCDHQLSLRKIKADGEDVSVAVTGGVDLNEDIPSCGLRNRDIAQLVRVIVLVLIALKELSTSVN
jgi:hypothetical protein